MPTIKGETIVLIVNWRELNHGEYSFSLESIGINHSELKGVRDLWE